MSLKIIYAGTPEFAVPCLQALIDSPHEVVAVYTQPDRAAGRGRKLTSSPVKALASAHNLPVEQPVTLRDEAARNKLNDYQADIMVVAAYGLLLPQVVLDMPKYGCINVHASLLPRWRGAAPIQYSLLQGDKKTGVTLMQMVRALDAGDMLLSQETEITSSDNSQNLHDRLSSMGAEVLLAGLNLIEHGKANPVAQDASLVTYAPKISKAEAAIDWSLSAVEIEHRVRAFYGWPVAFTHLQERVLRVWEARASEDTLDKPVGTLVVNDKRLLVACGEGVLELLQVQLPGGKVIASADFLNAGNFDNVRLK